MTSWEINKTIKIDNYFIGGRICFKVATNQQSISISSSHRQKSWAQESEMEVEVAPLTITPNILLTKCFILNLFLCSTGLEDLVPSRGHNHDFTEIEVETGTGSFGLLMPLIQKQRRIKTCLV